MVGARPSMPDTFDGCGVLAQTEIGECAINENEGCAVDTSPRFSSHEFLKHIILKH